MTDLTDFGGGVTSETEPSDSKPGDETAKNRRKMYDRGRCRGISKSKGRRCGGGVIEEADDAFCFYHDTAHDPVTVDDPPDVLARWCGTTASEWDEIPPLCRQALRAVAGEGVNPSERYR